MKKYIISSAILLAALVNFTSCKKSDNGENPSDRFDNFIAARKSVSQTFTLNAATGGTVTGKDGTKITFPAGALVDAGGAAFTGTATVVLRESLNKKQWMMDGQSATTKSDLIQSGGMIDVWVKRADNGADLSPAPAMRIPNANLALVIKAEVPRNRNAAVDMNLFVPDSIAQGGTGTTSPTIPTNWSSASYFPFGNGPSSYIFQLPKFHWANCDALYSAPGTKTTIRVTPNLTSFTGASQIQVMLVFQSLATVVTLPPYGIYFESYLNSIPVGSVADVVIIGKAADGKILFKVIPANTFTALQNINITPDVATAAQVDAYLSTVN